MGMYWVWGTRSLGMGHRRPELRASMGTAVNPLGEYFVILLMIVVIVGAVAREPLIAALGALAFVIAVSSRIWAALSLEEITIDRAASIDHAFQGDEIEITFTVENKKPLPVPWIEINEFVPRGLLVEGVGCRQSVVHRHLALPGSQARGPHSLHEEGFQGRPAQHGNY